MKKAPLLLTLGLFALTASAQQQPIEAPGKPGMYPQLLSFPRGQEPQFVPGTVLLKTDNGIQPSNEVLKLRSEKDALGMEHIRYQQTIHAIPVEGAVYIAHVAEGRLKSQNGEWFEKVPENLSAIATISPEAALQSAMKAFGAKSYKWQLADEEAFIKNESSDAAATFYPKAELVYYAGEQNQSAGKLRLAYRLDLYAHEPVGRRIYFVDAETGAILGQRELMHTEFVTGTAVTGYNGTQLINTEKTAANGFRLREVSRGQGIQTYNLRKGTNYSQAVDFTDADNNWNNVNTNLDQYATDAHWGAEKTYDYYLNVHKRNSIDGNGFALKSYVHYSRDYFNAFWDGSRMTYGDGDAGDGYRPLTSLDVCGHEITHGLTERTANLNYSYESGALNEGFSDIFGTMIEFYAADGTPETTPNWLMGDKFETLRDMSNPTSVGDPDTYKGTRWYSGSQDNGGVHTNSNVLNYWFYLLSEGGMGTNGVGVYYDLTGQGLGKAVASQIAYRTLTKYLFPTAQFVDACTYSVQAAMDLFPNDPSVAQKVKNAWAAVNVKYVAPPPVCSDVFEPNESLPAAKSITSGVAIAGKISTKSDQDWYVVSTTDEAPMARVNLTNLPADYDARLWDASGKQVAYSSKTGTANESLAYSTGVAATYYVQVFAGTVRSFSSSNCYTLQVDATAEGNGITAANGFFSSTQSGAAMIFPNPADQSATLRYQSEKEGSLEFAISDPLGRIVSRKQVALQKGSNDVHLDLASFGPGMYFVQLPGGNSMKFFVQH